MIGLMVSYTVYMYVTHQQEKCDVLAGLVADAVTKHVATGDDRQ